MSDSPYNLRPGGAGLPRNLPQSSTTPPIQTDASVGEPIKQPVSPTQRSSTGLALGQNAVLSIRKKAEAIPATLSLNLAKPVELRMPSGEIRTLDLLKELAEIINKNDALGSTHGVKSEVIRRLLAVGILTAKGEYR